MKKIAILLGRGIEGCGVTKYTIELAKYFKKHDIKYKIFVSEDKKFTRTNAHNIEEFYLFKLKEKDFDISNEINKYDCVFINSLPPINFSELQLSNWIKLLKNITCKKILIQHDHAIQSIRRNGALNETIQNVDKIFAHSKRNAFSKYVKKIKNIVINEMMPGMYFDEVKDKYWQNIENQDPYHCKWIGRTTSWKGYDLILPFYKDYLMGTFKTTLEGIEKSPAYIFIKENYIKKYPDYFEITDKILDNLENKCYICGPFINNEMLHRLSKCRFGYQLSILKPEFISRSIEYTHCEVVCSGAIPIFRKEYGERCLHRYYNKPLINCKNNGTLWLSKDNSKKIFDKMKYLAKNPLESNEMRNQAYNFYKLHNNADLVFKELIDNVYCNKNDEFSILDFF